MKKGRGRSKREKSVILGKEERKRWKKEKGKMKEIIDSKER